MRISSEMSSSALRFWDPCEGEGDDEEEDLFDAMEGWMGDAGEKGAGGSGRIERGMIELIGGGAARLAIVEWDHRDMMSGVRAKRVTR